MLAEELKEAGGQEVLEESMHFRTLITKKKIEIVDEQYVAEHQHKSKNKRSPTEDQLNAILVPANIKAENVEMQGDDGGIPTILVGPGPEK